MLSSVQAKISTAIRIGGVDPAIIRELSGIYKPFVKAFKELISNAFDADADRVQIRLAKDFGSLEIEDDGGGLTPFEFRNDFTRVGGSHTRLREGLTTKGRPKIGSKGIGFLAVARYCSSMTITSSTTRTHQGKVSFKLTGKEFDLLKQFEVPIERELIDSRLKIQSVEVFVNGKRRKVSRKNYSQRTGQLLFRVPPSKSPSAEIEVKYELNCRDLEFEATIDFDYLLSLENKKDLEEIQNFCNIDVHEIERGDERIRRQYTHIKLCGLKPFVVRELGSAQRQGYVRNIESRAGVDRFIWNLRRCIPVEYDLPPPIKQKFGTGNLEHPEIKQIAEVTFSGGMYTDLKLRRPVWGCDSDHIVIPEDDVSIAVDINDNGLIAKGYILGSTEVIYPAEYRGLAIRVRNVQIGPPNFLGTENIATGATKAALSQITGEINVIQGLDAIDALNPGRESFYEENSDYKRLKACLVGEGESIGGLLHKVVKGILTRSQITSSVLDLFSRANTRRKALTNLALAINHYSTTPEYSKGLRRVFQNGTIASQYLRDFPQYDLDIEPRVPGFQVIEGNGFANDYQIDFVKKNVIFNKDHDIWNWNIFLLGGNYDIVLKDGTKNDPLCELDTHERVIYLNWGHPMRQQMGDTSFIKSSIAWTVAYHGSQGSIDDMMNMALSLTLFD